MSFPNRVFPSEIELHLAGDISLHGDLHVPRHAKGLVLFAHGSGSNRHSQRNQRVAASLQAHGLGTLLFDLLTEDEEIEDVENSTYRFDVEWLATRLRAATAWVEARPETAELPLGYFGASTGAAAALLAAVDGDVSAIVSRGGRPDLALEALPQVHAATLFIVGGDDSEVLASNWVAYERLTARKRLEVVPGAGHLFEEPGALEEVSRLAIAWFTDAFAEARGRK